MSNILGTAVSGLNAASARIANASQNIVNASSTNYTPQDIVSLSNAVGGVTTQTQSRAPTPDAPNGNGVDIAAELVASLAAKANYGASAAVVKVAKKLDQALLDIVA